MQEFVVLLILIFQANFVLVFVIVVDCVLLLIQNLLIVGWSNLSVVIFQSDQVSALVVRLDFVFDRNYDLLYRPTNQTHDSLA